MSFLWILVIPFHCQFLLWSVLNISVLSWLEKFHHKRFQESPKISTQGRIWRTTRHIISLQDEHISFVSPGIFYQGLKVSGRRVPKRGCIRFKVVYLVIRSGPDEGLALAWNPVALCCLPLCPALSPKAIHQRIDTFIRRPNTSRPEYLPCSRSLHFSKPYAWLTGGFDQTFIFAPESTLLSDVQTTPSPRVPIGL